MGCLQTGGGSGAGPRRLRPGRPRRRSWYWTLTGALLLAALALTALAVAQPGTETVTPITPAVADAFNAAIADTTDCHVRAGAGDDATDLWARVARECH